MEELLLVIGFLSVRFAVELYVNPRVKKVRKKAFFKFTVDSFLVWMIKTYLLGKSIVVKPDGPFFKKANSRLV